MGGTALCHRKEAARTEDGNVLYALAKKRTKSMTEKNGGNSAGGVLGDVLRVGSTTQAVPSGDD